MFKAFEFCIPTKSTTLPDSPDWLREVKYDGYRLRLRGDATLIVARNLIDLVARPPKPILSCG